MNSLYNSKSSEFIHILSSVYSRWLLLNDSEL